MSKKKSLPECLLCTKLTIQHKYIRSRIGRTLNEISVNWCGRGRFDDGATIPADIERTSYRLIPVTMPWTRQQQKKTQHKNWSIGLFLSFYGDSAYIRYRAKCVARMCCTNYESSAQLFDYLHCCSLWLANLHCKMKTKCFTHLWAFLYGKKKRSESIFRGI